MSEPSSETPDLVIWKQFCEDMNSDRKSPFNFGDRTHVDKLYESMSNMEQRKSLEPGCQERVDALADAVSMLYHEVAAHANGPPQTPWGSVEAKQNDVFKALRELVHDPKLEEASPDTAAWLRLHVFAVLLHPPPPPEAVFEKALRLGQNVLSGSTSLLKSVFGTAEDVEPSLVDDDDDTVDSRTGDSTLRKSSDVNSVAKSSGTSQGCQTLYTGTTRKRVRQQGKPE